LLFFLFSEIVGNNVKPVPIKKKKKTTKKKKREKILENLSQIFCMNTYVFIFFPYVGLIYSFVQYAFSLTKVTS